MAPEVEPLLSLERPQKFQYFIVDLKESDNELDITRFDDQVKHVIELTSNIGMAKFIVAGEKMLLFPRKIQHSDAYESIKNLGSISENLKSAGFVFVMLNPDNTIRTRGLDGQSTSLEHKGLRISDSDEFKNSILKEKLGKHFQIT